MENTETQLPLVADADPAFVALRADVRYDIRVAEVEFQTTIIVMLQSLTAVLPVGIVIGMQSIIGEVPAKFIRSMLPFFQSLSEMRDQAEAMQAAIASARNANLN